jgi:hypothetical protein
MLNLILSQSKDEVRSRTASRYTTGKREVSWPTAAKR